MVKIYSLRLCSHDINELSSCVSTQKVHQHQQTIHVTKFPSQKGLLQFSIIMTSQKKNLWVLRVVFLDITWHCMLRLLGAERRPIDFWGPGSEKIFSGIYRIYWKCYYRIHDLSEIICHDTWASVSCGLHMTSDLYAAGLQYFQDHMEIATETSLGKG